MIAKSSCAFRIKTAMYVSITLMLLSGIIAARVNSMDATLLADTANALVRANADRTTEAQPPQPFILEPGDISESDATLEAEDKSDLDTGIALLRESRYDEAIPILEAILEKAPTTEAAWEALGWAYHGAERTDDTKELWQKFATLRPDAPKAHSLLAQFAILRSDWRSADIHLAKSLELDPDSYDIRFWYAQNLFRLGRLAPAVTTMEQLLEEDNTRYDVKTDLARLYSLIENYESSYELWREIVDASPENLDYRTEYARIVMMIGDLETADLEAQAILSEDPERVEMITLRADIAEQSAVSEIVVQNLMDLIDQTSDEKTQAQLRVRLAVRYLTLHNRDAKRWPIELALEQYAIATRAVPHNIPWLNQYAAMALVARQADVADKITTHILEEINPFNNQALRTRFELAMLRHDYDQAEHALNQLYQSLDPSNPYRHYDQARIEVQRGRFFAAMDELDKFEAEGHKGAVFTLLYHGLTQSEWMALTSTRRLQEHLMALRDAGYSFIAVSDIPSYLKGQRLTLEDTSLPPPRLARTIDNIRYAFTGQRKYQRYENIHPLQKVAVVTFDDGLRSSFQLGTPIAEDLQIPFWMAIITHIEELNALAYAAWEEIRAYYDTGVWEMGSHMMWANTDTPAGPPPAPPVPPLPNRIWLPERNRLETMREWTHRVRSEFEDSRRRIENNLDLEPEHVKAVAYPYGDIGQAEGSNVARLLNPIRTILNEASRVHSIGFIVDPRGYTMPNENMLMIRRYEPNWDAEAEDVLEHALMTHPVMMARRLRAEIAVLSGRPYLANQQIELLRRDGYPDRHLRELINFAENRAAPRMETAALGATEREARALLRPSNLYIAGSYHVNQSNEEIRQEHGQLRAGMNLNPRAGIEAIFRDGTIKQTFTSNVWFTVQKTETTTSNEIRTETVNGVTTVTSVEVQSSFTSDVQTNRIDRYEFSAEIEELRGALTLRLTDDANLGATFGIKRVTYAPGFQREPGTESATVGSLFVSWNPYYALTVSAGYQRDLVPSAREKLTYDALALGVLWKIQDSWEVNVNSRYASYEDNNAMLGLTGVSMWELIERQGIWGGIEAAVYTMDESSDLYWTPYWDTRYAAILQLRRAYPFYFFRADLRIGYQKEKGRPEEVDAYRNLRAQAASDGTWDPGVGPGSPRDTFVGLSGDWRQRIWKKLDLFISGNINFLREYSEHDLTMGIQLNF